MKTIAIFCMPIAVLLLVSAHYELRLAALNELHTAEHSRITEEAEFAVAEAEISVDDAQRELQRVAARAEREIAMLQARQEHYWDVTHIISSLGVHAFDVPLLVRDDADMEIVDMLVEHFDALFAGDEQRFRATVSRNTFAEEFLVGIVFHRFRDAEYYRAEVKFIASTTQGFVTVFVLAQRHEDSEPELYTFHAGINAADGRWLVHDHD